MAANSESGVGEVVKMNLREIRSSMKEYKPGSRIPRSIWAVIGLPSRGTRLHDLIHLGLPFEYLDLIANLLQVERVVISKAIGVSPTTLASRAKTGRLNTLESDRLVALIAVFEAAFPLFEGDVSATTEWMNSPVRGLGLRRPIDMLGTRVETNAVFDLIGQLERGVLV
jgi:putative toxin-antitoxin system antitoxin component (TIGR02293 family)